MDKRLPILIGCALAAASCEISFELDNVSEPAIHLQYLPQAGCGNGMIVSYAEPAFGSLSKEKYPFSPSDVTVTINGKAVKVSEDEDVSSWNGHMLLVDASPSPGDEVEVTVKGRGIPDAVAHTTVPQRPAITAVSMIADTSGVYTIKLNIGAPVRDGEFYGLMAARRLTTVQLTGIGTPEAPIEEKIDTMVTVSYFLPGRIASLADLNSLDLDAYANVTYDGGFITESNYSSGMMALLQKRHFVGDTYTFYANSVDAFSSGTFVPDFDMGDSFDFPDMPDMPDMPDFPDDPEIEYPDVPYYWEVVDEKEEYRFELFRLSEEFYNYAKAQYLSSFNMLSNFGVTPPNFTYTNVSGGLGIVAGLCSCSTDWIAAPRMETE